MSIGSRSLTDMSESLAFLGNSLLAPMSQTGHVGFDPSFWASFPDFADEGVREALGRLSSYAQNAQVRARCGENVVQQVSVEYAKLFVGPPKPAAPAWETAWRGGGAIGYGEAAVQMRHLLSDIGLEVSNGNNQYPDHIGIELLYASTLCRMIAAGAASADGLRAFLEDHPLHWIGDLRSAVKQATCGGYYEAVLMLAEKTMLVACAE